jgi:endoglycosylceramidase
MRRLLAALVAIALALPAGAAPFPWTGRIRRDGAWLRDREGRVVLLRGLNYSGLEFGNFIGKPNGPAEADFAQMASWGADVVRLPLAWHYLEPAPGIFELGHLREQVDPLVRFARRHGVAIVLELHQFQWSPCTGGNGVPAWTCAGKGYAPDVFGGFQAEHDFWHGALAPDGRTLIAHLVEIWRRLARHYRRTPAVVGFDFLNEPLDALALTTFEHDALYPFYRDATAAVRRTRASQVLFLEPYLFRNVGFAAHPEPVGDANLVYAPHLYTITGGLPDIAYTGDRAAVAADYAQAAAEAAAQDAVLWTGEYGGNTTAGTFRAATEAFLHDSLDAQDTRLVGGAAWAYFPSDNTFSLVDADGAEKGGLVDAFARPYPMVTAGIPQALSWDAAAHDFTYTFAEDPARDVPDPTVVFLPAARHFPGGFAVETTPGDVAAFDPATSRLVVRRDRGRTVHTVRVHP